MPNEIRKKTITIACYNVENLFDTLNDPLTLDNEFTPKGKKKWCNRRYKQKIKKISSVISIIGTNYSAYSPAIIGLVEIENKKVLHDLVRHNNLLKQNYSYIHHNSSDKRGIDVALLYKNRLFTPLSSKTYPIIINEDSKTNEKTRDLLVVEGILNGDLVHILINHWPSRKDKSLISKYKRIAAAKKVQNIINSIKLKDKVNSKFIIMGDFNDDPSSESVEKHLVTKDFHNPMSELHSNNNGTLTFNGNWHLFDQIIISKSFFKTESSLAFIKAGIFKKPWMKINKGKYKGSPFRTFIGPWYKGGFSDHFPVYIVLRQKEKNSGNP
ncbi:endonuclease/exonuclease/phosphatase family protein [Tenacibaculum sp. 190524A02b]|uniref:endonuclease/exonuclease/phosphatase family protein n=1 Tax=Tenacibaculum vairaonense TaxID=3137860 RepID=UPI0031FAA7B4